MGTRKRYIVTAQRKRPTRGDDDDSFFPPSSPTGFDLYNPTVYCLEAETVDTGLVDQWGDKILSVNEPEPIGFTHHLLPSYTTEDPG